MFFLHVWIAIFFLMPIYLATIDNSYFKLT